MKYAYKIGFLLLVISACLVSAYQIPAFPQDPAYHNFVDQRLQYNIANFWNIASNLPFLLFGLIGLAASSQSVAAGSSCKLQRIYTLLFTASILIAIGSAYYHLNPSNATLVFDRLPMAIAFMAFFSIVIAEYLSLNLGRLLFLPLLAAGMIAVIYWFKTEQSGAGDIRPYLVIQFLPMILIPLILLLFKNSRQGSFYIWAILGVYVLSKLAEYLDADIYIATGFISGHSIKHLLASTGILFIYLHFRRQRHSHD